MNELAKKQFKILNQHIREINAIYHHSAIKFGISDSELWVLYALLVADGEYSQQDICEIWCLPKQTVNSVITNLTKKGYVFQEAVPGTRNRKKIYLTDEGKRFSENTVMHVYEAEQRTLAKMSDEERQTGIELLSKYVTFLSEEIHVK